MTDASDASANKMAALWRGVMHLTEARKKFIAVRCTDAEHAAITARAAETGLSVGAFLRKLALGRAGRRSVRRPPADRAELARLLGSLGKLGSLVNQIAKAIHTRQGWPGWLELAVIREDVGKMRAALLAALGRDHQG